MKRKEAILADQYCICRGDPTSEQATFACWPAPGAQSTFQTFPDALKSMRNGPMFFPTPGAAKKHADNLATFRPEEGVPQSVCKLGFEDGAWHFDKVEVEANLTA